MKKDGLLQRKTRLSKERLKKLEEILAEDKNSYEASPGVYLRSDKDRELDLLWQGVRNAKQERSPGIYLSVGFVTGAVCMFLMSLIFSFGVQRPQRAIEFTAYSDVPEESREANFSKEENNMAIIPVSHIKNNRQSKPQSNVRGSYVVREGDTLDKIALRVYGVYSSENINKIIKANNLPESGRIRIGQELTIPGA